MIKSKKSFFKVLKASEAQVQAVLADIDAYYYENKIPKLDPFGKPKEDQNGNIRYRILHPSKGELKYYQRRIKNIILTQIKLPECAFGGVKGKCNILNARCHVGKKYKFVSDLSDFFPSIGPSHVYKALINENFSPDVASIITRISTWSNSVPQGAPTSTHIANIVLKPVDIKIMELAKNNNITYSRFVDDLAFSSHQDFRKLTGELISPMLIEGFRLSQDKTNYKLGATEITGIWVRNNDLEVSDLMKEKIQNPQLFNASQNMGNKNYTNRVHELSPGKNTSIV